MHSLPGRLSVDDETQHPHPGRKAAPSDVDLLIEVANQIEGKTVCAFGEAASWPTQAMVSKFKEEFVALTDPFNACLPHTEEGREQNRFLTR